MAQKKYRVHRLEIKGKDMQNQLEQFLNDLEGEVISILPNIKKKYFTSNLWCYSTS